MKAYSIVAKGRVQRVGYRRYLLEIAQDLGISGYVENKPDGTVAIFIQGDEDKLSTFIERAKSPGYPAVVKDFIVTDAEPNPELKYFIIKFGSVQEELQEGFGALQSIFMDYWSEFRDYRNEFRDYRQEFRDYREEFRDYREEFRDYRREFREFAARTDENFKLLMDKYGEISRKLTEIMDALTEQSKKLSQILDELRRESKETREMIYESLKLLREAVDKIGRSKS